MDKFFIKGAKKLLSLSRTKIRLAEEADTIKTKPKPLPLVKRLSGEKITTIPEAKEYIQNIELKSPTTDYAAKTVLELIDIIEGVKYRFEPPELCVLLSIDELKEIEKKAINDQLSINLLLMAEKTSRGINIFTGENPPKDTWHLGRVPSTVAFFLDFAFQSNYFSDGLRLKNIRAVKGKETLINYAIYCSLKEFGAGTEPIT